MDDTGLPLHIDHRDPGLGKGLSAFTLFPAAVFECCTAPMCNNNHPQG